MTGSRRTAVAMATGLVSGMLAASMPATAAEEPQRVEITGSSIRRTDQDSASPLEVVTREQIRRSGATSINELMKSLPAFDRFDQGEITSNVAAANGTAFLAMRGTNTSDVLVLLNGRRVPVNPLADTGGGATAFDINQIPVSAIDRIEILKDGGSAIYGADATAGVVNFILRKDYVGVDLRVTIGESSRGDAAERQASITAGFGRLAEDGFNLMVALDAFTRDPLLRTQRDISRSADFRRFGPIPGFNLDNRLTSVLEGNFLNAAGNAFSGQQVRPCPPERLSGGLCRYDFNANFITAYNDADRLGGLLAGTLRVSDGVTAHVRLIGAHNENHFDLHPLPDLFPHPSGLRYTGRFMQGGPRASDRTNDFVDVEVGLQGSRGSLDWDVGLSHGKARVVVRERNVFDRASLDAAVRSGAIDPTVLTNDPALIESLKLSPVRNATTVLDMVDGKIAADAFALGGGTSRYAVGFNVWRETMSDRPDPLYVKGLIAGSGSLSAVEGERDAKALFAELQLPVTKTLEGQLAARYDKYDTVSAVSSKAAATWQLLPALTMRASYTESFRTPTLKQLFASSTESTGILSETQCRAAGLGSGCAGFPASFVLGANPQLDPEKGKTINAGLVGVAGDATASVDFWQIHKHDAIGLPSIEQAIERGLFERLPSGRLRIFTNLQNIGEQKVRGADLDSQLRLRGTPAGTVLLRAAATYYAKNTTRATPGSPWIEYAGMYINPRWRATLSASFETGPWTVQSQLRSVAGFWDAQTRQSLAALPPEGRRRVGAHDEWDLTASYSGFGKLTLSAAVKNLFDRMPPFSATNATNFAFSNQGFAELYTSRGRFFQLSAGYRL
ncbi:TonB-dependent receptor [Aquincola sp. S2]|uniref:TonB-dependent receptor n=1 Tax=Pseudaquabacterium terrae TaxID=2732868 RepID=A0ABX2EIM0_9BURK|nr:TonB-dependent receptor [Aquabacterium terrae]NRF68479.1 TonB-dependent receptor [Aquabacterium terrae]